MESPSVIAAAAELPSPVESSADPYRQQNDLLFAERASIKQRIVMVERVLTDDDPVAEAALRRLRRRLEDVTAQIVEFNLGLVRSYCGRFTSNRNSCDTEDFHAAGMVGLMKAIDTYEPTMGKFSSWAFKPIRREVLRAVRSAEHQTVNTSDFERRPEILSAYRALRGPDESHEPTHAEVAALIGARVEQVARVLAPPSLETTDPQRRAGSAVDHLASVDPGPDAVVMSTMTLVALRDHGLSVLDARELFVLVRRFGLDGEPEEKLAEIGETLAISREAVRQIESKALAKIQHPMVLRRICRSRPTDTAGTSSPVGHVHARVPAGVGATTVASVSGVGRV